MSTINRTIETDHDRNMAARLIEGRGLPFTLTLTDGKHRTTKQNKLQRLWMNEISEQKGDMKPEEVRAYCKLTIGVPILRAQNEAFRDGYDRVVKPLPYEQKLAIMAEPLDMPITRLMTTAQKTEYLDGIIKHFAEQGIVLTMPDDMRNPQSGAPVSEGSDGDPMSPPAHAVAAEPLHQESGEAEEEAPDATGPEPAHGEQAASSSELVIRNLMVECLDKFMALATDPSVPDAKERRSNVEFAKNAWKDALPQRLDFVKACFETADKVVRRELQPAPAKRYLEGLL
jgi:hypothetical protein